MRNKSKKYNPPPYWYILPVEEEEEQNTSHNPLTIIDMVKLRYARMENEELIHLAHKNGNGLSTEAISALYKEFLKRKLDISIFPELRASRAVKPSKVDEITQDVENAYIAYLQEKCLNDISQGRTLDEVFNNLQKAGLRNGESLNLINSLEVFIKELENDNHIEKMRGAAVCLLGFFLIAVLSSTENSGLSYTGLIFVFVGIIKIFNGFNNKSNHTKSEFIEHKKRFFEKFGEPASSYNK